jgi:methylated-DNA-[protein]-cysteine S-methyltransferase
MTLHSHQISSPVGLLTLVANEEALVAILWEKDDPARVRLAPAVPNPRHPVLRETERQLAEYFAGQRTIFDLPLAPAGTPFQQRIWAGLLKIPYGKTRSYSELAAAAGSPKAARATGHANGRNPISIVIPCHRAIGADGSLTGFAGGLATKATLLELEGRRGVSGEASLFSDEMTPIGQAR